MKKNTNRLKAMKYTDLDQYGYGEVIFHSEEEFPAELDHNGCHWFRSRWEYAAANTGMQNFLYETYDRKEDLRLYVDAAGRIWDEKDCGIL